MNIHIFVSNLRHTISNVNGNGNGNGNRNVHANGNVNGNGNGNVNVNVNGNGNVSVVSVVFFETTVVEMGAGGRERRSTTAPLIRQRP